MRVRAGEAGETSVRGSSEDRPLNESGETLSETRKYRKFTAQQKSELVLASLRGQKTIAELCREHEISETLLRRWREQFLAAGAERLSARAERTEVDGWIRALSAGCGCASTKLSLVM